MKKSLLFLLMLFFSVTVFCQQQQQFTQNMFNHLAINPGYAGSKEAICGTLLARQQWLGFKDAQGNKGWPQTNQISIDAPISFLHGGAGITIFQDELGLEKNISFALSYAYRLSAGPGTLGIGAQVYFLNKDYNFGKFIYIDQGDPVLNSVDELGNIGTDFTFGLYYKIPNKLYFGVSSSQLSQPEINFSPTTAATKLSRHYYVSGGYYFPIPGNPSFELDPSILIKSDFSSTQFDVNMLLKYNNQFWGGVSYRPTDAVALLIGMNWKSFHFGYSYDITTSDIKTYSSGSHELMIGYCFKLVQEFKPESYRNPRFL